MERKVLKSFIRTNIKNIVACSHDYKLLCVDDKPFKLYLDENGVYNFINSMIKESKYCSHVMKKNSTKNL